MTATRSLIGAALAGLVMIAAPGAADAQQADGWWDWAFRDFVEMRRGDVYPDRRPDPRTDRRTDRRGDIIFGDRRDNRGQARGGRGARGGPPFCANGQGHPVHGRQWCVQQGFGLGGGTIFERRRWDDVVLRTPRGADRRRGVMDRGGLIDVLGDVVYGRIASEGTRLGAREPLTGRWLAPQGSSRVLQIRSGTIPVAELTDLNGDGRIDAVLIPQRR